MLNREQSDTLFDTRDGICMNTGDQRAPCILQERCTDLDDIGGKNNSSDNCSWNCLYVNMDRRNPLIKRLGTG